MCRSRHPHVPYSPDIISTLQVLLLHTSFLKLDQQPPPDIAVRGQALMVQREVERRAAGRDWRGAREERGEEDEDEEEEGEEQGEEERGEEEEEEEEEGEAGSGRRRGRGLRKYHPRVLGAAGGPASSSDQGKGSSPAPSGWQRSPSSSSSSSSSGQQKRKDGAASTSPTLPISGARHRIPASSGRQGRDAAAASTSPASPVPVSSGRPEGRRLIDRDPIPDLDRHAEVKMASAAAVAAEPRARRKGRTLPDLNPDLDPQPAAGNKAQAHLQALPASDPDVYLALDSRSRAGRKGRAVFADLVPGPAALQVLSPPPEPTANRQPKTAKVRAGAALPSAAGASGTEARQPPPTTNRSNHPDPGAADTFESRLPHLAGTGGSPVGGSSARRGARRAAMGGATALVAATGQTAGVGGEAEAAG